MVARTVEFLKEEEIGNICLFADADGDLTLSMHASIQDAMWIPWRTCSCCRGPGRCAAMMLKSNVSRSCGFLPAARIQARSRWRKVSVHIQARAVLQCLYKALALGALVLRE